MMLPFFLSRAEDIPDIDDMAQRMQDSVKSGEGSKANDEDTKFMEASENLSIYNDRMMGVFQDMHDLGYIWDVVKGFKRW